MTATVLKQAATILELWHDCQEKKEKKSKQNKTNKS